ncbi:MAG: hypothetical protein UU21_C0008G0012 [Candidatus Levybacteria bacterium GW2011_GWA2_40_8]|nr:MAG: hypothetical protein UU21_C0008G0012 [Candidatus Levybacteria bacterium GW2011_GWA2_40_8]
MGKNFKEAVFIFIVAVVLSLVFTYPAVFNLTNKYLGDGGDNYEYVSYSKLVAHQVSEGNFPYSRTNFWRYPEGFSFYLGSDSKLVTFTGGLISLFTGSVAGYNLTILLIFTLNGILSYLFFRSLSGSKLIGIVGMLIYGFSFNALAKGASHANLLFNGGFSLFAFSILGLLRSSQNTDIKLARRYFVLLLTSVILTSLGSSEYLFMLVLFAPIFFLAGVLLFRDRVKQVLATLWADKKRVGIYCLVFFVILFFLYLPHLLAWIKHEIIFPDRGSILYVSTPSLADYVLPNSYLRLWVGEVFKNPSFSSIERSVFFGFIELLLFLIFFFTKIPRKIKIFLLLCFLIPLLLSFGYGKDNQFPLLPYRFLSDIFPFSTVVQTGRYVVVAYFFSAIGIAFLLKSVPQKIARFLLIIIILLLFAERIPSNTYLSDTFEGRGYYKYVANEDSQAVLDLPLNIDQRQYNIASFYYEKPIVNGYIHYFGDGKRELDFILRDGLISRYTCSLLDPVSKEGINVASEKFADKKMISLLKNHSIKTIVLHKDDKYNHPVCQNVRAKADRLFNSETIIEESTDEKKITLELEKTSPNFTFIFPKDGVFFINGVVLFPADNTNFNILHDGNEPSFDYSFLRNDDYKTWELRPKYQIQTEVNAGSKVTIQSDGPVDYTRLDLWYKYLPARESQGKYPQIPTFTKVYEDDTTSVYRIN